MAQISKTKNINTAQRVHVEFPVGFRCQFDISECTSVASSCLTSDERKKTFQFQKKMKKMKMKMLRSVSPNVNSEPTLAFGESAK